ncbi:hypothetical protein AGMMS49593_03020 [Endomicrobiia bacterium]|nr:hypothetical protein AGMMS49593_03020 [Endomicrobiia bacterium]
MNGVYTHPLSLKDGATSSDLTIGGLSNGKITGVGHFKENTFRVWPQEV